jgi:serine/threonine-protein kinase
MAPEVIDGKPSDHRCDIFSLGTILYWLCTGQLPFEAPNPSALFRRILEGNYDPPQMLEPKIGNGLARIIEKALAQDPEARYQDVSLLEEDLLGELKDVELDPPSHLAKQYLLDPKSFADELGPKLIARLAASGEAALAEGNVARAMDRFNRVLAIDPHHEKVKALSARIGRKERLAKRAKQGVLALGIVAAIGGAGYAVQQEVDSSQSTVDSPRIAVAPPHTVVVPPPPVVAPPPPAIVEPPPPAPPPPPVVAKAKRAVRVPDPPAVVPPADIHVDGAVYKNEFLKQVELAPGRHEVFAEKPRDSKAGVPGRYAPKVIEVDDAGELWLIVDGKRGPKMPQLLFKVARDQKEIDQNPDEFRGWTSY